MTILQLNKTRLENYLTTRNNPDWSLGIYLTNSKVAQCRLVDKNRRENKDKKETLKNTAAQKLYLQQKKSEAFKKCQDSMYGLSPSTSEESMFTDNVNLPSNTLKYNFENLGGKLGDLPNKRREILVRDISQSLKLGPE